MRGDPERQDRWYVVFYLLLVPYHPVRQGPGSLSALQYQYTVSFIIYHHHIYISSSSLSFIIIIIIIINQHTGTQHTASKHQYFSHREAAPAGGRDKNINEIPIYLFKHQIYILFLLPGYLFILLQNLLLLCRFTDYRLQYCIIGSICSLLYHTVLYPYVLLLIKNITWLWWWCVHCTRVP